jgi:hypothetical protein
MEVAMIGKDDFIRRARAGDGPSWRWQRAGDLLDQQQLPDRLDDEVTAAAWRFRSHLAASEAGVTGAVAAAAALPCESSLSLAHAIYNENGRRRWEIEARLLTGLSAGEIAQRLESEVALVETFAAVFFDVAGRTNSVAWLAAYLPIGLLTPANPTEGQIWMHVAASGDGARAALDVLIGDHLNLPEPAIADRRQVADDIRTIVRFTCTPPTPTPAYRRLLNRMWQILATRVTVPDAKEWEVVVGHMEVLELAAGVRQSRRSVPATASESQAQRSDAETASPSVSASKHGVAADEKQPQGVGLRADDSDDEVRPPSLSPLPAGALFQAIPGSLCWPQWSPLAGLAVA